MSQRKLTRAYREQVEIASKTMRGAWDPIRGGHAPGLPEDEYSEYAGRVVSLLSSGASDVQVADYLGRVERDVMGMQPADMSRLTTVARQIRQAVAASSERAT